jgi:broad specificity phosphatase PhoE
LTEDNEAGIATGWLPGRLSARGREQAAGMGRRRRGDRLAAVFSSDLRRSVETAELAFGELASRTKRHGGGSEVPILYDWRLRECDFGRRNGTPVADIRADRREHVDRPYPGGESRRQAVARVAGLLDDLPTRWAGQRVLLIGHAATQHALEHVINGVPLEELTAAEFQWRETGWEYRLG